MIFVCVGSRGYQFNRLLETVDCLVGQGHITEDVFAQIGGSDYQPVNYPFQRYLDEAGFRKYQNQADIIISHGGTGALVTALKLGKQVIAVPRRKCFGEHIDDHQMQVSGILEEQGYLRQVLDMKELEQAISLCKECPIEMKFDIPSNIISIIDEYIERLVL